jgi:hypothetical protein
MDIRLRDLWLLDADRLRDASLSLDAKGLFGGIRYCAEWDICIEARQLGFLGPAKVLVNRPSEGDL